jgi:molybdate transport system ATP-binding protein
MKARGLAVALRHVSLRRGGRQVLRDLSWSVRPGERWVLLGANGAGKTQLLKLLAGDVWPQPHSATRRIYQLRGERHDEPVLAKDEIAYVGSERQDRYEHYDWNDTVRAVVATGAMRSDRILRRPTPAESRRTDAALRRVGVAALARRKFLGLSQGERRLVLLARALAWRPFLLLLDEPLNGLDPANRVRVLEAIGALAGKRLPWICATHRAAEVPPGATHLAVLERGRLRVRRAPPPVAGPGTLPRSGQSPAAPRRRSAARSARALVELRAASLWREGRRVLAGVSMRVEGGHCWVVHGANGSGKSTLLGALYGLHGVEGVGTGAGPGAVRRAGQHEGTALAAFQRRTGWLAPELQLALPRAATALETVVAGWQGVHRLDGPMTAAGIRNARAALRRVRALGLAARRFGELSYGQARRVLFARALARTPRLLLLDEPYTGLDPVQRLALQRLVYACIARGCAVVIACHHRDEWPAAATHELELAGGEVRYAGARRP